MMEFLIDFVYVCCVGIGFMAVCFIGLALYAWWHDD